MRYPNKMIKLTPYGECKGTSWDECGKNKVVRIYATTSGDPEYDLYSLQFAYLEGNSVVLSDRHGGDGYFHRADVNYPDEYFTSVYGCYYHSLQKICFGTKTRSFAFGNDEDYGLPLNDFCFDMGDDFYGFHGYSDTSLNAIGVYIKPNVRIVCPSAPTITVQALSDKEEIEQDSVNETRPSAPTITVQVLSDTEEIEQDSVNETRLLGWP